MLINFVMVITSQHLWISNHCIIYFTHIYFAKIYEREYEELFLWYWCGEVYLSTEINRKQREYSYDCIEILTFYRAMTINVISWHSKIKPVIHITDKRLLSTLQKDTINKFSNGQERNTNSQQTYGKMYFTGKYVKLHFTL